MRQMGRNFSVWVLVLGFLGAGMLAAPVAISKSGSPISEARQARITPEKAIRILKKGNRRFVEGDMRQRDYSEEVAESADGQFPFAAIVGCLDSRVPPEVVFDRGIGDLFVARVAGNFVNDDILGSLEFAGLSGVKAIVILGHTSCGAVINACNQTIFPGLLATTLANINPAVQAVAHEHGDRDVDDEFVQDVADMNVHLTVQKLLDRSLVLRERVEEGSIQVVGAMYDLSTGKVEFFD